jgi:hypothetical protein
LKPAKDWKCSTFQWHMWLCMLGSDDERDEFPSLWSSCQMLHLLPVAASSMGLVGIHFQTYQLVLVLGTCWISLPVWYSIHTIVDTTSHGLRSIPAYNTRCCFFPAAHFGFYKMCKIQMGLEVYQPITLVASFLQLILGFTNV